MKIVVGQMVTWRTVFDQVADANFVKEHFLPKYGEGPFRVVRSEDQWVTVDLGKTIKVFMGGKNVDVRQRRFSPFWFVRAK